MTVLSQSLAAARRRLNPVHDASQDVTDLLEVSNASMTIGPFQAGFAGSRGASLPLQARPALLSQVGAPDPFQRAEGFTRRVSDAVLHDGFNETMEPVP